MSFRKRILEENTSQKKLFNHLIQKENLNAGYLNADIGHDNSYFLRKKDYLDMVNALENPNEVILKDEEKNPDKKTQRLQLLKQLKNLEKEYKVDDGVVMMGSGPNFGNKPEVLAHEVGHASNHKEQPYLGPLRHPFLSSAGSVAGALAIATGHPITGGSIIALSHLPTLYDEGKASLRGYKNLKELNKEPKKKDLLHGFSTYALSGLVPAAAGTFHYKFNPRLQKFDDDTIFENLP
jgi:hypothetical protein